MFCNGLTLLGGFMGFEPLPARPAAAMIALPAAYLPSAGFFKRGFYRRESYSPCLKG